MKSLKYDFKHTPRKWVQIGDVILLSSSSLSAIMMGAPFGDHTKTIIIFALNVFGVLGKVLTGFAKMKPEDFVEEKADIVKEQKAQTDEPKT